MGSGEPRRQQALQRARSPRSWAALSRMNLLDVLRNNYNNNNNNNNRLDLDLAISAIDSAYGENFQGNPRLYACLRSPHGDRACIPW
jgi:hypothetical protein